MQKVSWLALLMRLRMVAVKVLNLIDGLSVCILIFLLVISGGRLLNCMHIIWCLLVCEWVRNGLSMRVKLVRSVICYIMPLLTCRLLRVVLSLLTFASGRVAVAVLTVSRSVC